MNHNPVSTLPITTLVETLANINKIWDQIYAEHEKEISELIVDGYDVFVMFYSYMLHLKNLSDSNAKALKKIIDELEIAKKEGGIDAEGVKEIDIFSNQILDSMKSEHNTNFNIHKNIVENRARITKTKQEMSDNVMLTQMRILGKSFVGGTVTGGAIGGTVARGAPIGTGGALAIGSVVGAGVLGIVGQVYSLVAKSKFHKLELLLDALNSNLEQVQVRSEDFSALTSSLVDDIREQVICSGCLVRVHNSTEKQRVINAITNVCDQSILLKDGFCALLAAVLRNITDLRIIVARSAPTALIAIEE
ncbi:MAG: hypothetical protein J3R72DRAFT_449913 [Linnemannia gamsii]|nr:MAG: hypothetical protein J3R72DRAFT_449913 [Linnemannia gamsii]